MKIYEKPTLVMMSIAGNDLLCSSCDIDVMGENKDPFISEIIEDFGPNPFEGSANSCDTQITGYCKFSATTNVVINS